MTQAIRRVQKLLVQQLRPTGEKLVLTRAPGRLNLIGEHTDYNDGFVMPVAVDCAVYAAAVAREDCQVRAFTDNLQQSASFGLDALDKKQRGWVSYLQGVAWVLQERGVRVPGADVALYSEVPVGAGLSSSAALEVAWALALLELAGETLSPRELALACQRAENEYVGMRCGILDQFACVLGREDAALLIDCESQAVEPVSLAGLSFSLVVCDTKKPRQLVDSDYNKLREQCEAGAHRLGVPSLRHASREQLLAHEEELEAEVFRRCWHVVTENERVLEAAEALRRSDLNSLGRLVSASHRSLRDYYGVSCAELEAMWEATQAAGCYGSRLVGAGFGGAVLALVPPPRVQTFAVEVGRAYTQATGRRPEIFSVEVAAGAQVLEPPGQLIS
jgi:galactokinase